MPVEFLTDDQVAAYGRVPAELPRGEIERWWHFDDADRVRIDRRRRAHNRVGFGVQLGTVRMIGRLQDDPLDVPTAVLDYVAEQLGEDASNIKAYGQRPKPRHKEHRNGESRLRRVLDLPGDHVRSGNP